MVYMRGDDVIEPIEKVQYVIYFNDESQGSFDTLDEAIDYLKGLIDKEIARGYADDIDFSGCWVESELYYEDDDGEPIDWDSDSAEVEYCADSDPDYEEYFYL